MNKHIKTAIFFMAFPMILVAQEGKDTLQIRNKKDGGFIFTVEKETAATPVKNQNKSGTCWSFSSVSFIESELLRMGKGEYDLSEMFVVRHAYFQKAVQYVMMHGKNNFGAGGAFHDVTRVIKEFGIVPQEVYDGNQIGEDKPVHGEMDAVLQAILDAVISNKNGKLTPRWKDAYNAVLDTYLGKVPESFEYKGKTYTPKSFAQSLGINTDDYVEITSYTHHPFYQKFIIEVPDNWAWDEVYNVPLNEFSEVLDYAINNGYSVAWGSDISEKTFKFKEGVAFIPEKDWEDMEKEEKDSVFNEPQPEKKITQEMRQEAFDNYTTTDDHGMHITGIAKDQLGTKYYIVKNSWGCDLNDCGGYFYASEAFVLYKTMDIMVHKNAIPKAIAKKLGL